MMVLKFLCLKIPHGDFELINEQLNDAGITLIMKISWVETEDAFISSLREKQ